MPISIVTLIVPSDSSSVNCANCNQEINIINKPSKAGENRLYCPGCTAVLKLYTEEGHQELNRWWAGLDSFVSRKVGKIFQLARFPSKSIAEQWHEFETEYPEKEIVSAASFLAGKLQAVTRTATSSAWSDLMAMMKKRRSKLQEDIRERTDEQVVFEMPPGREEGDRY